MSMDRSEAGAILADIAAVRQRVLQSAIYRASGQVVMFWGAVVAAGDLTEHFAAHRAGWAWVLFNLIGVAGTVAILARARIGRAIALRVLAATLLFFAFGLVWSLLLGQFGPRELAAFWPTLFMFGYAIAGLWLGRVFAALGLGLTALILAGYFWSGDAFALYLALANGGGLLLCGAWMRRA